MNSKRRKELSISVSILESAKDKISEVKLEEEFVYDGIPDNLKESERGIESENAIDAMDESIDMIDEIIEKINDIIFG